MVVRKEKRRKRYLGQRSRGAGNTKNRRGAGNKGGRGRAGSFSHKAVMFMREEKDHKLKPKNKAKAISIRHINRYVSSKIACGEIKASELNKGIVIDFKEKPFNKYSKLIGRNPEFKYIIKNVSVIDSLRSKIEAKGGSVE